MKLKTDEAAAINCHMGFSDGGPNTLRDAGNARRISASPA